jgi:hypothetical protein
MERIDLAQLDHEVHQRWTTGEPGHWRYAVTAVGQLADGRWFATKSGWRWDGAYAAADERQACEAAERWMARRGGDWIRLAQVDR